MAKRLGKDQRNKFLTEFEKDGKIASDEYYAKKDKNGKVQIRRIKQKKSSDSEGSDKATQVTPAPETPATETPKKEPKEKTL